MLVVGAEHAALDVLVAQQRRERLEVARGGALADHDKLAALELGNGVVELGALVVGVDARGDVGVEVVALEAGCVAVNLLVVRLRGDNFLHDLRVGVDRADEIHHLGQPLHARIVIEAVDGAVVEVRARLVERRGWHTARQHEAHVDGQILRRLNHILDAVGSHDVRDLVRVGDDRRRAVRQDGLGKLPGADKRALEVDVRVDEAGEHDLPRHVDLHMPVVGAHADDQPLRHGDVPMAELVGKHVDIRRVLQHQIRGRAPGGHVDDVDFLVELAVNLAGITLNRHRDTPFSRAGGHRKYDSFD